jgi:hypothetical protein
MRAFTTQRPPPSSSSPTSNVRSSSSRPNVRRPQLLIGLARARKAHAHNVGAEAGTCGNTLRSLAVTADGYTLDNPYGRVAYFTDVSGWRALAHDLQKRAREHFDFLGEIEKRKAAESDTDVDYTHWNMLVERWNGLAEKAAKIDDVGGKLFGDDVTEAIAYCTSLVAEQICFLEDVDAAIVSYGETPPSYPAPVKPAPPPASTSDLAGVVIKLGAVAIGAYVIVNVLKG